MQLPLCRMLLLIIVFSCPLWGVEKPTAQDVGGNIDWVFDYEEGKKLSTDSGKPMFVVFRCER